MMLTDIHGVIAGPGATTDQSSREQELRGLLREWQQAYNRMDDVGVSVADFQSLRRRTHEALSSPTAITAEEAGREGEAEHIEAVIACLGDDAASIRADSGNPEDERAANMDDAASLLARLLPSAPAQSGGQG